MADKMPMMKSGEMNMSDDSMNMDKRTPSGDVSAASRQKHGMKENGKQTGRFPIFDKKSALAALKLRGRAKNTAERRKIIDRAKEYAPEQAKAALEADTKAKLL